MLYQGHIGAPSYRYTGQGCPQFWNVDSLVEWKRCHYIMVEADIHLRLLPTSILDIYNMFEPLACCLKGIWMHPYIITSAKLAWKFWCLDHLWSENDAITWWLRLTPPPQIASHIHIRHILSGWHIGAHLYCYTRMAPYFELLHHLWSGNNYIMVEADIHLRLLPTSTLDISKVVEPLFCCLKGLWVHRYTITQVKLGPRFLEFWVTCVVEMMLLRHGWGKYPPQTASHIHIRHIESVWGIVIVLLNQGHKGAPSYHYVTQAKLAPNFVIGHDMIW